jgi:hypothetical protein
MPEPTGIVDTALERRYNGLDQLCAVRQATAVSRQGLPPHSKTLPRIKSLLA